MNPNEAPWGWQRRQPLHRSSVEDAIRWHKDRAWVRGWFWGCVAGIAATAAGALLWRLFA